MAKMTVKQMITALRGQGYKVEAYKRPDGSYLIKEINGVKYEAAKGNAAARNILNNPLSVRRQKQLKSITPKAKTQKAKIRKRGRPKLPELPKDIKNNIRKVRELFRENVSQFGDYVTITTASIRKIINEKGLQGARDALDKAQRYAEGYAYIDSVEAMADRFKAIADNLKEPAKSYLMEIYNKMYEMKNIFKEEWMGNIKDKLYDYDKLNMSLKNGQAAKELRDEIFRMIGA